MSKLDNTLTAQAIECAYCKHRYIKPCDTENKRNTCPNYIASTHSNLEVDHFDQFRHIVDE